MGHETVLFSSKEPKSRAEVSAFLRHLADRLEGGQITLRRADNEIVLSPAERLVLEIKAEDEVKRRKGTQHSLEIELKWYDGDAGEGGVELA